MQQPNSETVTLNDILMTEELSQRAPRPPNWQAEAEAMRAIAQKMAQDPERLMQTLVDTALELCQAGTTGVSLLETIPDGEEFFRWSVLAGTLAYQVGGSTPRNFSPCGVCLEQGSPVLFSHPERYFTYFQDVNTPIVEGLVLPLVADSYVFGTIWIMSHDQGRHFDAEDVRVMTSLANFTATALLLQQQQTRELLAANMALEVEIAERKQAENALRESEAKYRSLFNSMDEGFHIIELINDEAGEVTDYRFLEVNPAFERLTSLKNAAGKLGSEIAPKTESYWIEAYSQVAQTGEPLRIENYNEDTERWYSAYASRVGGVGSRQVAIVFDDITDRKRQEAKLAFLNEISQDLAHLTNIDETMNALGKKIGGYFDLSACAFAELNETAEIAVINYDWHRKDVPSLVGTYRMQDFVTPEILQLCRAGEAVVIRDVFADPLVDGEQYAALNIGSFLSIPLVRNGEWRFLLVIYHTEPHDWRDDEIELTRELANRIWTRLERARAEVGLSQSEEKYRLLFNSINEGYALCELLYDDEERAIDWKILQVNPAFEFLTGLHNVAGKTATQLNQPLNQNWLRTFSRVAQTGESARFEHYIDRVNYWFEILVSRIDADKHHIVVVFNNITDRKQAAADQICLIQEQAARQQERQRAEALADLDRAKTLFFSNISHEFRTPLTLLLAPLQDALSDPTLAPIHRERLELAHRNSLRLLKLVNTLLDFSRIEAGRIEAIYEPTHLAQLTTDLASVFRSAIERAGLQLIVDCPPLPEPVYVDREMWEKIVLNLLSNALKFTFTGDITVRIYSNNHQAILQIQDTGTGIAAEHLPHLFERFYQVRGEEARTHEGSGIGLALVNELVQLQGGAIAVTSMVGEGTCFTITLPFRTDHLPPERIQSTRTLTSTALRTNLYVQEAERWLPEESGKVKKWESNDPHTLPPKVLIVDDNADMRQYLTRILSEYVQVEAVADGAAALAAIQTQSPDLVLSDVMMPRLNGFGLLQTLRSDPRTREVPVILLSARAGEEAIAEGLDRVADDYLIKPFSAHELISRVNAHLQISHLRGEALHEARTAIRRKDELLSVVSHELNTPLVSILGWTRLLRANPPNPAMLNTALDTIERSATMQAKLVQDLLDISRITASKLRLNLQPIELNAVIEGAIATVTQLVAEAEIHLIWTETTTAVVMGDRERLQQVVCNLLTNAIKFTPADGRVEVHLSSVMGQQSLAESEQAATNDDYAEIRVTDTGIGIEADFLPHIFEQFRQAEGKNSVKGLGLGLAIAHHIVELHNGTIQAQSAGEGQGSTFIIKLPLLQSNH